MTRESKYIATDAATAKRIASSVRKQADRLVGDVNLADRGVLLTAARILDVRANTLAAQAKTTRAAEHKYDQAYKAALPEATKQIETLPQDTTLDRVALISMANYRGNTLNRTLIAGQPPKELQWSLDYWFDTAKREEVQFIAHQAAKNATPVGHYASERIALFNRMREDSRVIELAQRFDRAVTPTTTEATA